MSSKEEMAKEFKESLEHKFFVVRARRCCGGLISMHHRPDLDEDEKCLVLELQEYAQEMEESVEEMSRREMLQHDFCPHLCHDRVPEWAKLHGPFCSPIDVESQETFGGPLEDIMVRKLKFLGVVFDGYMPSAIDINKFADKINESFGVRMIYAESDAQKDFLLGRWPDGSYGIVVPRVHSAIIGYAQDQAQGCYLPPLALMLGQIIFDRANPEGIPVAQRIFDNRQLVALMSKISPKGMARERLVDLSVEVAGQLHGAFALWHMGLPRQVIPWLLGTWVSQNPEASGLIDLMTKTVADVFRYENLLEDVVRGMGGALLWEYADTGNERAEAVSRSAQAFLQVLAKGDPIQVSPKAHPGTMIAAMRKMVNEHEKEEAAEQ